MPALRLKGYDGRAAGGFAFPSWGVQPAALALARGQLGPADERLRDTERACAFLQ